MNRRLIPMLGTLPQVAVFLAILVSAAMPVRAAELLMIEEKWCDWCALWNEEIGVVYHKTAEGRKAPLRRVSIHDPMPEDVVLALRPQFTPTFVLLHDGREIGRIEGYPGEDFFWPMLGQLLQRLDAANASVPRS